MSKATRQRSTALRDRFAQAVQLMQSGRVPAARELFNQILAAQPTHYEALHYLGLTHVMAGELAPAEEFISKAISLKPGYAEAMLNLGKVYRQLDRLDDALAAFDRAATLTPDVAEIYLHKGLVLSRQRKYELALASYERAIALQPEMAAAHHNRGNMLNELNRVTDAKAAYERALAIAPDFAGARNNLWWLQVKEDGDWAAMERSGAIIWELNLRLESNGARRVTISHFRLQHDLEQIEYLVNQGHRVEGMELAQTRMVAVRDRILQEDNSAEKIQVIPLSEQEARDINLFRDAMVRYQPPSLEHALNPDNNWREIEDRYFSSYPEIIHVDNLLAPRALEEMRKFCLMSTLWKAEYEHQYLGAFANMGFISPLHLQIARELKQRLPRIYGGHQLEQLWAYKYNSRLTRGINVHADMAQVNLNFWITPDEANLDPDSGGLIVYDVPPPSGWSFEDYNVREEGIYEFLRKNNSGSLKVPHRCNRGVLFNSALFHETDEIHFREGYENRRINITYLFGKQLRTD